MLVGWVRGLLEWSLWISWVAKVFLGNLTVLMGSSRRILDVGMTCSPFYFPQWFNSTRDF